MADDGQQHSQARIQWVCASLGLAAVAAAYLLQVAYFWDYTNDDAFITLRYSRFLALGRGPYFNAGEHVEGYTNFSLMLLLSLVIRLFGAEAGPFAAKLSSAGFGLLAVASTWFLIRHLVRRAGNRPGIANLWALAGAGIVAINPGFAVNCTSGLETSLFSLCLIAGVLLASLEAERERWLCSGLAFGVGVLTRPEGSLLFAVFWSAQALAATLGLSRAAGGNSAAFLSRVWRARRVRVLLVNGAIVAGLFALHLAYRHATYDGEWLPNTYFAKAGGFWAPAQAYVAEGLLPALFGLPGVLVGVIGLAVGAASWRALLPLVVVAALGGALPFVTGTDWMVGHRLLAPYLPLVVCAMAAGWANLAGRLPGVGPTLLAFLALLLPFAQGLTLGATREAIHREVELRARGFQSGHRALADWLVQEQARPGDTVALMDIGIIGYRCIEQKLLDITGLTNRFIAKSPGGFLRKEYDPQYVLAQRPEFIVLTFTGPGVSYEPAPPGTRFGFWTRIEERLYRSPAFQESYLQPFDGEPAGTWLEKLARRVGAVRVFEHADPGQRYLLAVFRRRP